MARGQREFLIQREFVKYMKLRYPRLLYCASAGGLRTSPMQAIKMKATGYKSGYPDMSILEPSGPYHGLFIEIKKEKDYKISEAQKAWIDKLNKRGYYATICKGLDECITTLDKYLANEFGQGQEQKEKAA